MGLEGEPALAPQWLIQGNRGYSGGRSPNGFSGDRFSDNSVNQYRPSGRASGRYWESDWNRDRRTNNDLKERFYGNGYDETRDRYHRPRQEFDRRPHYGLFENGDKRYGGGIASGANRGLPILDNYNYLPKPVSGNPGRPSWRCDESTSPRTTDSDTTPSPKGFANTAFENQRLEELALKQSRQLIPMIPSYPKTTGVVSRDKVKPNVFKSEVVTSPRPLQAAAANRTPVASNLTKTLSGKLHVLSKPNHVNGKQLVDRRACPIPIDNKPVRNGFPPVNEDRKPAIGVQNRKEFYAAISKKSASNGDNMNPNGVVARCDESDNKDVKQEADNNMDQFDEDGFLYVEPAEERELLVFMGWQGTRISVEPLTQEEIVSFVQENIEKVSERRRNLFLEGPLNAVYVGNTSSTGSDSEDEARSASQ